MESSINEILPYKQSKDITITDPNLKTVKRTLFPRIKRQNGDINSNSIKFPTLPFIKNQRNLKKINRNKINNSMNQIPTTKNDILPTRFRILTNPFKEDVRRVNLEEEVDKLIEKRSIMEMKKNEIDESIEVKLKRLGLYRKEDEDNIGGGNVDNLGINSKVKLTSNKIMNLGLNYKPSSKNKVNKLENKEIKEKNLEKEFKNKMGLHEKKERELAQLDAQIQHILAINDDLQLEMIMLNSEDILKKKLNDKLKEKALADDESVYSMSPKRTKKEKHQEQSEEKKTKFENINKIAQFNYETDEQKTQINNLLEKNNKKLKELEAEQSKIIEECRLLKTECYKLREILIEHYHLNLYEGLDFKSEGLVSIIKAIWNLGVDVDINYMPTYLDKKSIMYLFNRAKQFIELSKLRLLIDDHKKEYAKEIKDMQTVPSYYDEKIKKKRSSLYLTFKTKNSNNKSKKACMTESNAYIKLNNSSSSNEKENHSLFRPKISNEKCNNSINSENEDSKNESGIFKTRLKAENYLDVFPKSKKFMERYFNDHVYRKDLDEIKSILNYKYTGQQVPKIVLDQNSSLDKLKYMLSNLKNKMNENEKNEIRRINKEFTLNNYGKIHDVCIEVVIAALCGEDKIDEEVAYCMRLDKEYRDNNKKIKFYSTLSNEKKLKK